MKAYFNIEQGNPTEVNYVPELFFFLFDKYLTKKRIDHNTLVVPHRSYGHFDNLVNLSSCDLMIRVNSTPPFFISSPKPFTIVNEIPYLNEGMEFESSNHSY